jgi:phospholipid/cholesterol/gamma-HCH transport system substrate-binding protein
VCVHSGREGAALRHSRQITRAIALLVLVVAVAAIAAVLLTGRGSTYAVTATFDDASQLVRGNTVQVAGVSIGSVDDITLTNDGRADVRLEITDEDYAPLRRGTEAIVRLSSLSGVANRYVDLRLPPGDLDQLLNALDGNARRDLQGVIQGFAAQSDGASEAMRRGWVYLNPALAASSRLFQEVNRDTPALNDFLVENARLVGTLSERREDLTGVVDELEDLTRAVGSRRDELSDALVQLPPFMRRANSTFVNLRAAVDDLRPLVEESRPAVRRLRPFFAELRPLARDARPTLRDLSAVVRSPNADDDLIDLARSQPALRDIAVREGRRNGATREGAFPATVRALRTSTPELAYARPYAPDLTGWFDDFGHSGVYDALGGKSRVGTYVNAFANVEGVLRPIAPDLRLDVFRRFTARNQRNRCPGAAEQEAADRSNPWRPTPDHNCDPSQVLPGR